MQKFWVIRKKPYRETSAILTVLVNDNRLVRCIARGGSKVSEFQPLFGVLSTKGSASQLSKIEPVGPRLPLAGVELISALYLNEITHWIIAEGAEVDGLFDAYTRSITQISQSNLVVLRDFERILLEAAGQYPLLDQDREGNALRDNAYYRLHDLQKLVEVNPDEVDALATVDWQFLASGEYSSPTTAKYAKWLHRMLIDAAVGGRRLVSREMLLEVGKSK